MVSRPNPFDFSNPVTDRSVLAGRGLQMKQASYYLDQSSGGASYSLAMIGDRASGKTSLLNALADYAADTGLVAAHVRLDEGVAADDLDFFREIFHSLMVASVRNGLFGGEAGAEFDTFCRQILHLDLETQRDHEPLAFGRVYARAKSSGQHSQLSRQMLLSDLDVIVEKCRGAGFPAVLLILDEGDVLAENHALLQALRNLLMSCRNFSILIAGTERMFPAISDVFSPVPRQFVRINVGPFPTWRDTRKAILSRLLLAGQEWAMPPLETCQEIHSLTSGSPYEVMLLSHFAYRELTQTHQRLPMTITPSVIEAVADQLAQQNPTVQETISRLRAMDQGDAEAIRELIYFDGLSIAHFALAKLDFTKPYSETDFEAAYSEIQDLLHRLSSSGFVSTREGKVHVDAESFQRALIKYVVIGRRETEEVQAAISNPHYEIADRVVDALKDRLTTYLEPNESAAMISELQPTEFALSLSLAFEDEYSLDDYSVQATCQIKEPDASEAAWAGIFVFRQEVDSPEFRKRLELMLKEEAMRLAEFGVSIPEVQIESVDREKIEAFSASSEERTDGVRAVVEDAKGAFSTGSSDFPSRVAQACSVVLDADASDDSERMQQLSDCAFMVLSTEHADSYAALSERLQGLEEPPILSQLTLGLWEAVHGNYGSAVERISIDESVVADLPDSLRENLLMYSPAVMAGETPMFSYEDLVGSVRFPDVVRGYAAAIKARASDESVAEALGCLECAAPWLLGAAADAAEKEKRPDFAMELRQRAAQSVDAADDLDEN